jgi:shikimate kinase
MPKPNIMGFMGTGKTTVGKKIAQQLAYDFVDTDELIQERAGKTVPEIFQEMGEVAFREMEASPWPASWPTGRGSWSRRVAV